VETRPDVCKLEWEAEGAVRGLPLGPFLCAGIPPARHLACGGGVDLGTEPCSDVGTAVGRPSIHPSEQLELVGSRGPDVRDVGARVAELDAALPGGGARDSDALFAGVLQVLQALDGVQKMPRKFVRRLVPTSRGELEPVELQRLLGPCSGGSPC
jgi:hypothetical protein